MGKQSKVGNEKKQQRILELEKKRKTQKLMGWSLAIIFLLCIVFIVMRTVSSPNETKTIDANLFQYEKQPVMGSKDAPIKMVEFFDFKCPSCKDFDQNILPEIKKEFIDKGIVSFYSINYPIINPAGDSRTAALAGEAVFHQNPDEYWKFYEAVFKQQRDEKENWATSDFLVQIAKEANVKIDYDKLKQDIDNKTFASAVNEDEALVGKLGVNSTPTLFINGKEVSETDTFSYEAIKQLISKAQNEAGK